MALSEFDRKYLTDEQDKKNFNSIAKTNSSGVFNISKKTEGEISAKTVSDNNKPSSGAFNISKKADAAPVYAPTLEEERANERDKMLTPSASRTPTFGERLGKIVTGAAKSTGASYVNNVGTAIRGEAERQKQQSAGEIAAWQDTIKAYQDMLADPTSTQSERETATAVIADLQRRIGAYGKAYGTDGANERAANTVYGAADRLADSANADIERAQEGLGTVGKLLTGAGVAGTQMAIDMLTAPPGATLVPLFFRASGQAAQGARREGADFDTANTVGGITGAVEVLTEKMFDGLAGIYGGGAADDLVAQFISKHTSSPAFGRLLSYAASAAGESVEEVVSGLVEPALKSIYNKKAYGENFDPQELLESAIIGGLLGLVGGNTMYNNVLETDAAAIEAENEAAGVGEGATERALEMLTGRTTVRSTSTAAQDAQESAQSVSRETMAPARETPQSGAQAQTFARYYEQDVRDMTGELGGKAFVERYDGTQDIAEYTAGFVRYWNAGATGRKIGSVQNTGGLNELQRYAAYYAGQNDAARSTVSEQSGVRDVAINAQRGLSSDDTTARNTAAWSDELRGTVDALGRKLGVRVVVDDTFEGVSANGYYDAKTNEIHLAKDSENPVLQVVRHEATHRMQQLSPKEYRAFRDYAVRMAGEDAVEEKRQAYSRGDVLLSEEEAMDEIAAETAEKLLTDETAISDFIRENRTAAQKFYDALRSVVQKVREALGADQTLAQAERLWKNAFEKADAQAQENAANKNAAQTDGGKRFMLKETEDGKKYVRADRQVIFGNDPESWSEQLEDYINGKIRRGKNVTLTAEDGDLLTLTARTAGKVSSMFNNDGTTMSKEAFERKVNAGAHIDELAQASIRGKKTVEDAAGKHGEDASGGWNYRKAYFMDFDGKYYLCTISVEIGADGNAVYNIGEMKERSFPDVQKALRGSSANGGAQVGTTSSEDIIRNSAENSKRKFSLKTDSEGRELSEQQQEYFKDSKSVDTDGRLKVMYQGGNGDFTVFDRKKSKGSNLYGRGFYFTDSEAQAKQYGGTRAFYLNVTNPLTPGQNSITRQQMRDFLSAVAENEDYGLENYGYGATVDSVLESVYGKGDFEMLQDVNATAIGDLVAAAELFNEVNGTDYDGIILPTETVTFRSNQAKNVTNAAPTDNKDIRFSLKAATPEEAKANADAVLKFFGRTYNWNETGYITADGSRVDLSGRHDGAPGGYRTVDHRDVRDALGLEYGGEDYSGAMVQFMHEGNIRISPESGGINVQIEPTKAQYDKLEQFVQHNKGEVTLDLDDENGNTVGSVEYAPRTRASKVISDIKAYFADGTIPEQTEESNFRYSLKNNSPEAVAAKQQEMIEYLRGQLKRSRGVTTNKADVAKIARATAKAWDSSADVTERLQAMYDFMANGKDASGNELTWDDLWSEAKSIAGDMLSESMTRNDDLYREYADMRRTVRDTKLNVPKEMDGDLDVFGGYGAFRRGEGRALNLSRSEGTGIDDFFQTLSASYPEFFSEDATSNPADQLARIAEVMNDLKPVYENRFAGDEQAVNYLADELINSFYDARQEAPTFADKAALDKQEAVARVKNAARDKMQTREAKLRSAYDERIAKMREMNRQKIEERMSKLREQRDNRISSLKRHYKEAEEARRNQKRDSEARTRLLNIARRLNNKKLPAVSKSLIQQYIGELDLTAKSMTGTTLERLTDLQAWYADQKETNPDFISDKNIEKALQRLSKKQIADLTADDVESLTRVLLNIENEIRTQRKLIDSQVRRDTYLAGDAAITDIENSKGSSGSKIDTFLLSETLSPMREMHRITGYVDSDPLYVVTQELADGQRKMFDYQRRANNRFKTWIEDKEFVKTIAGKDATEITITGIGKDGITSVKITPAMRMSLYLHSLNDQNLRHIAQGGITVPDITLYKKGNIVEAYNKGKTIKLTPSEVRRIAGGMRGKEHAFARAAYDYYNGQSQSEINATSERLKGYSVATVDNYFPVDTDRSFLKAEFDSIKRDGTIEGMGFLKERIDAANPIMLYDMNSVLTKSINQHSKFVGMAIPVRNFSKLWGVTTGGFNEDGSRNNFESSVQKAVKEKRGQNGYDYIEQMMADLNNVSKGQKSWGKALASARGAYAGAVLELNASVAIKQAASYPTAASVVGFKPLIKALGDTSKINTDQIARYTPLLWYRSQGYSSQELGELAQRGKSLPKALNWIQAIDVATTTKLWKAAEYYVRDTRKDLERASEAYYREVANVYNRIIEETQPNYTTMQRPALLRSDNELVRTLNMFKTQPFQNFNILYDGIENMNAKRRAYESDRGEESRKAYNEAKTAAARAITSQAVSSFVFALMQYAWDAFRGKDDKYKDEDDEYSIGAWLKAMGFNMLTNGFGMFPFGSEVLEAAETLTDKIATTLGKDPVFDATYYGVDVSVVDTVNNTVNDSINGIVQTIATIQTAAEDDKKVNWESYARTMYKAIVDYAQLAGVPIDNVRKTAVAVAQQAFKAANGKYVGGYYALRLTSDPAKYSGDYYDLLYKAYKKDKKSYEEVYRLMVDDGLFSYNKIKTAMEDRMKDEQKVANVRFLSQRYYSPEQQKQYDAVMSEVQSSPIWKKASEEQRRSLNDNANTLISGNGTDAENMRKKILEGKKYGLTEGEYLLYELALKMVDQPSENGNYGSYTNDEVEGAIRMLQGLSDKERSYLWSTKRDSDKNNPWK